MLPRQEEMRNAKGGCGLEEQIIPPFLPLRKCVLLNGVKNNQGQLKRKARPLYDPGRPGGAGPPTRQSLCPVHRGLILICLCISLPCLPPAPIGRTDMGWLFLKRWLCRGVEPNDNQAQSADRRPQPQLLLAKE